MRTSKPISTISYNTPEFLNYKLDELYRNHKISDWIFINHFAEEDERKDHIHLWIKPNTLLDTMDLQKHFIEPTTENPLKPLKCIDFRPSNIDDWLLYSMHYEPYLKFKNEFRQYHYNKDDFVYCDEDSFEDLFYHALKGSDFAKRYQTLKMLQDEKISPAELVSSGVIPLERANALYAFMSLKTRYGTYRGGRKGHEDETED